MTTLFWYFAIRSYPMRSSCGSPWRFGALEQTHGGTPGPIHFRTEHEVRKLGASIKDFSNIDASGKPLATDSRAYLFKLADQLWHSDSSFNAVPASYSLLSGRSVPSWGGNTEFADMRAAYDALNERLKHKIEDLVCTCIPTCIPGGNSG